jgi:hypothetical protein
MLRVVRNEIQADVRGTWDITFEGQVLVVRTALRKVALRIRFVPPRQVVIERASILRNGVEVEVFKACIKVGNQVRTEGNYFENAPVGFVVGWCPSYPPPAIPPLGIKVDRYR